MMEFLFLDLDDTILDFHKAERIALSKTLTEFGVEPAEEVLTLYHRINLWHWEQLEKGKLTRDEVQVGRFAALFRELGVSADAVRCTRSYEGNLAVGHYFLPGAEEAVANLSQKYRLFLASNGTASVQSGRLTSANLYRFFETVFISQELGFNKPAKEFFDACFARIPDFDPKKGRHGGRQPDLRHSGRKKTRASPRCGSIPSAVSPTPRLFPTTRSNPSPSWKRFWKQCSIKGMRQTVHTLFAYFIVCDPMFP